MKLEDARKSEREERITSRSERRRRGEMGEVVLGDEGSGNPGRRVGEGGWKRREG